MGQVILPRGSYLPACFLPFTQPPDSPLTASAPFLFNYCCVRCRFVGMMGVVVMVLGFMAM